MSRIDWLRRLFFFPNCVCWASAMVLRDLKPRSSFADARFKQLGDLYLWTRILKNKNIYILEGALTEYRIHEKNESQMNAEALHNRSYLEYFYIFNFYRTLSVDDIKNIFYEYKTIELVNSINKDYFIAKVAINLHRGEENYASRSMFGIMTLFEIYSDKGIVHELFERDGFTIEDFYSMTGAGINISYTPPLRSEYGLGSVGYERELLGGSSSLGDRLPAMRPDKKRRLRHLPRDILRAIRLEILSYRASF